MVAVCILQAGIERSLKQLECKRDVVDWGKGFGLQLDEGQLRSEGSSTRDDALVRLH